MQNLPSGLELRFHPDEQDFPTWYRAEDRESKMEYPCFFNKGKHEFADGVVYRCLGYQFYFQYNRAIGLGGVFPWSEALGTIPLLVTVVPSMTFSLDSRVPPTRCRGYLHPF